MDTQKQVDSSAIQIVDINAAVARQVRSSEQQYSFSALSDKANSSVIGIGDVVEVTVWEAPPAVLFGSSSIGASTTLATPSLTPTAARSSTLPEQMVGSNGTINIPFVGAIPVAGRSTSEVQTLITQRLRGKANEPQVLVRILKNNTSAVTIIGDVNSNTRMPLTSRGERILDALATAGGSKQPIDKVTLQLTRNNQVVALPLQTIIRDPKQNIPLQSGDIVTALYQPLSFTVMGAVDKNQEINYEAQGITLVQAISRAGGLQDSRSDAQGVFVFRFESPSALVNPPANLTLTPDGKVPVIYRINMRDPASFFTAQNFPIHNKDVLYVSNASGAELKKFLDIVLGTVSSVLYPVSAIVSVTR